MKIGYARVSTEDQNLDLQHDALMAAGCDRVFEDKLSGVAKRPGLDAALAALDVGDMLMVWKLDRLGRSSAELVRIGDDLRARGIDFKVLTGQGASIDTTRPEGRFFYTVMAAFAELDREITRERTIAGLAAARRRGKRLGRPPKILPEALDYARERVAAGEGKAMIARKLGVNVSTLRRLLNDGATAS